jgi:hypothetical protein
VGQKLGNGSFGVVRLAREKATEALCAVSSSSLPALTSLDLAVCIKVTGEGGCEH